MTVGELIAILEEFDEDMEVKIGMIQNYGSNFAMEIMSVEEHGIDAWYEDDYNAVVITQGTQLGTVNYGDDEEEEW